MERMFYGGEPNRRGSRGQKRGKGEKRRNVLTIIANAERQAGEGTRRQGSTSPSRTRSAREKISYRLARTYVLNRQCPLCQVNLLGDNTCPHNSHTFPLSR